MDSYYQAERGWLGALPVPIVNLRLSADADQIRENIRSACSRGLPVANPCKITKLPMSIVGTGPSLEDTWLDITGYIAATNGAHDWLLARDIVPHACGLMDPHPILADTFTPYPGVSYFVASMCHPAVFDKLAGHEVIVWHAGPGNGIEIEDLIDGHRIGGGSTIGLRWLSLGYFRGFRDFRLFGIDSSFRNGSYHAYEHGDDEIPPCEMHGYTTTAGLIVQAHDFFKQMELFADPLFEPIEVKLHGEGLLQHAWNLHTQEHRGRAA